MIMLLSFIGVLNMAELIIVSWKDIPSQVIIKVSRREQYKYVLEERFEKAIDRAAMRSREMSTDEYLAGFKKSKPVDIEADDLEAKAIEIGKDLEQQWSDEKLDATVKNNGLV